jgi:hypothetical protein
MRIKVALLLLTLAGGVAMASSAASAASPVGVTVRTAAVSVTTTYPGQAVRATCDKGEHVTGGGFTLDGSDGDASVAASIPSGNAWKAQAFLSGAQSTTHTLTAYAICLTAPKASIKVHRATTTVTTVFPGNYVRTTCGPGFQLTGGGFAIRGRGARTATVIHSFPESGQATPTWTSRAYLDAGEGATATLTSYAVCTSGAWASAGITTASGVTSVADAYPGDPARVDCPAGGIATGVGFTLDSTNGGGAVIHSFPQVVSGLDGGWSRAYVEPSATGPLTLSVFAQCLGG